MKPESTEKPTGRIEAITGRSLKSLRCDASVFAPIESVIPGTLPTPVVTAFVSLRLRGSPIDGILII
jgi:hypothetical protein